MIVEVECAQCADDVPNWKCRGRRRTITRFIVGDWRHTGLPTLRPPIPANDGWYIVASSSKTKWHDPVRDDLR